MKLDDVPDDDVVVCLIVDYDGPPATCKRCGERTAQKTVTMRTESTDVRVGKPIHACLPCLEVLEDIARRGELLH